MSVAERAKRERVWVGGGESTDDGLTKLVL
jgi:hypothetical protein